MRMDAAHSVRVCHWWIQGGRNRAMLPFQSYAVANTVTFLFGAIWEHDKNIQKREIFKQKFCARLPKRFQLQRGFAPPLTS